MFYLKNRCKFINLEKGKQRQKLLKQHGGDDPLDKNFPDLIDIIVSFNLQKRGGDQPIDEETIMRAVGQETGLPFKKLDPLELDMDIVTKTIPKNFAIRQLVLPFNIVDGVLEIAVYHPDCQPVLSDIEQANQVKTKAYVATKTDIKRILGEFFGFQSSISAAEDQIGSLTGSSSVDIGNLERYVKITTKGITSSDQHIKNAVNHIFHYALDQRASDIHIEPKREICHDQVPDRWNAAHDLQIAQSRSLGHCFQDQIPLPPRYRRKKTTAGRQDQGRRFRGKRYRNPGFDRPVSFGEKAVLRLLDPDVIFQSINHLGFSKRDYGVFDSFMHAPHGIVLVTGPTGSGKSTTLYSALKEIATPEMNLVTVEDPVEMVYEEFNQIAVQPLINVTFSTILRNILRQDPDVIMIGEIRDLTPPPMLFRRP